MTRVPGAARRLWRDRPRVVAVALLGVVAIAASALQTTSAIVLRQTLDQEWRGTYDILVTQGGKDPVDAELLRSDALVDAAAGRLSFADLELIRGLPGVDVAAPVAEVSFAEADLLGDPLVWLPVPVRPDASLERPQAFRITVSTATDDGTGGRELAPQTVLAFAYQPSFSQIVFDTNGAPLIGPDGRIVYATEALADSPRLLSGDSRVTFVGGAYDAATGTIPIGLRIAPRPAANIVLVDPVAERALLGEAGAFLDPIIEHADDGTHPLVVQSRPPAPLDITVTVEEFDEVTPGAAGADAVEQAQGVGFLQNGQIAPTIADGATATRLADYELDASAALSPYDGEPLRAGGIAEELVDDTIAAQAPPVAPSPRSIAGGTYSVPEDAADSGEAVELLPRGYASYGQFAVAPLSGAAPAGSVTQYSKLFGSVGGVAGGESLADRFEVVGEVDVDELRRLTGDVSFMPLGAYDMLTPAVVASAEGEPITPVELATSVTGFGVPGTDDLAIGSFAILQDWGVERPISAIRVRVVGLERYTADAQAKLLAAASALEQLGFEATIVAGSSPQPVDVLVRDWAGAVPDTEGMQPIADLGIIRQEWSRLGAVVEAEVAVSATGVALLVVAIVSVGVLLAVVQLGSVPARRAQAGVLRQLGWRRRRIAGWFLAEEAIALLVVALFGVLAIWLANVRIAASVSVAVAIGLVVVTSLAAVVAGARAPRQTARRRRALAESRAARVATPFALGSRLARAQPGSSAGTALAVLIIVVSVAAGAAVFVQGRELAGPSVLGAVASARAWVPQGLLAATGLVSGILLAVLSRRAALVRRREQSAAMRAMGWTGRDAAIAHVAELAVSGVPAAMLGVGIAALVAAQAPGLLAPVVLASVVAGALALGVVLLAGRRVDWRAP